jgi:hypothetical protein
VNFNREIGMASLDKVEGEAVEGVMLVFLVLVIVIIYSLWQGLKGLPKLPNFAGFAKWLADLFKPLMDKINLPHVTGGADWPTGDFNYSMPSPGELDGVSADWVSTGTSTGAEELAALGGS